MMMETILMMWMDHAVDVCVCVVCVRDIKSGICMVHVILLKGAKGVSEGIDGLISRAGFPVVKSKYFLPVNLVFF